MPKPIPTTRTKADYEDVRGVPIYHLIVAILAQLTEGAVRHVVVSRWSREGDTVNAAEQATKVLGAQRRLVPAVQRLLDTVPDDAWTTPHGRAAHNIVELRVRDVTPHRFPEDPDGKSVIGYLISIDDTLVFRAAFSGFKTIIKPDGDELSPYQQAVIELLKYAAATSDGERVCLRLSEDGTRKGRLAVEMGRLDRWVERIKARWFLGADEYDYEGFGALIRNLQNADAEKNRQTTVTNLMVGRLKGVADGNLPASEANLPPYLGHVIDPSLPGHDKRVRDGSHLRTTWVLEVAPALAEYVTAYARGAKRKELADILIRHRVPTPRQLPAKNGKTRYSSQRDTTFDQLPIEDARSRATRWLSFSGRRVRVVPADATAEERRTIEYANKLALRKLEVLRSGRWIYHYKNPTPTTDCYGDDQVSRSGLLDAGYVTKYVQFTWPATPKLVTDPETGVDTVTDELELDDKGRAIPWVHLGIDPETLDAAIRRLIRADTAGRSTAPETPPTTGMVRALSIDRWTTSDSDVVLQWEAMPFTSGGHPYRWVLQRPAPHPDVPEADLNLAWSAIEHDARLREPESPDRHVGTVRDYLLVDWARQALQDSLLDHLDDDMALRSPDLGRRLRDLEDHRRRLRDQADAARSASEKAAVVATGYEEAAMAALASGDEATHLDYLAKRATKAAEAEGLAADAAGFEAEAAKDVSVEAELPITHVSQLIEVLRRSAADHDGMVPAAVGALTQRLFASWRLAPATEGLLAVSCTARIPLTDGNTVEIPLSGLVPNTKKGRGAKNPYRQVLFHELLDGASFEQIADRLPVPTSRSALYVQARNELTALGVHTYRAQALLDHPHRDALRAVWVARTGLRPDRLAWTGGFEAHMEATYTSDTWAKAACPTARMGDIHRVFAALRQHPAGVDLYELASAAGLDPTFVRRLINPSGSTDKADGHRKWPRFLEWVPERLGIQVRAHPCPHPDCPAPREHRWASVAVFLPETAPVPGGVGGVLCPACRRLPLPPYAGVVFPADWLTPVARTTRGTKGSVRSRQMTVVIDVPPVAAVMAPAATVTLDELANSERLTRSIVKQILSDAQVPTQHRRGRGGSVLLFSATEARRAITDAFAPGGRDRLAYSPDALTISAAAKWAGVLPREIQEAVEAGQIPVHLVRNGAQRFLPEDIDRWRLTRGST